MSSFEDKTFYLTDHALDRLWHRFKIDANEIVPVIQTALENGMWYGVRGRKGRGKSFCIYGDMAILYNERNGAIITVLERTKARYSSLSKADKKSFIRNPRAKYGVSV